MATKLVTNSILFILIIISGIWLSKLGKPYNPVTFNIHKFIALAFIVYIIILSRGLVKTVEMNSKNWLFLILSGFLVFLVLVSGGIISSKVEIIKPFVIIHKVSSGAALIVLACWFYFALK